MKTKALLAGLSLLCLAAPASAVTLYRCEDGGRVSYTTERKPGCVVVSTSSAAAAAPAHPAAKAKATASPTPADFPRVSGDAQKSRDTDRRKILEQELAAEQKGLNEDHQALTAEAAAKAAPDKLQTLRDQIALHERNLLAMKKEIGNLK